jgi:hypothetical protein
MQGCLSAPKEPRSNQMMIVACLKNIYALIWRSRHVWISGIVAPDDGRNPAVLLLRLPLAVLVRVPHLATES